MTVIIMVYPIFTKNLQIGLLQYTVCTSLGVLDNTPETIYSVKRREIIMGFVTANRTYIVRIFCSF